MRRKYSRREFLLAGGNALLAAAVFDGKFIEPFWPEINTKRAPLPFISESFRILHLSDLHVFDTMPSWYFENVLTQAAGLDADFAVITGDFISAKIADAEQLISLLKLISNRFSTYATLGNHDGGAWAGRHGGYRTPEKVLEVLKCAGIHCLNNETILLKPRGQEVALSGTTDLWSGPIPTSHLQSLSHEQASIVLAHNPDTKDNLSRERWQVMLSGHTHGGQFTYPIIGGTPFCVVKDRRFLAGLNPWRGRLIHTSRGVGSTRGVRVFCAPEITVLEMFPVRA